MLQYLAITLQGHGDARVAKHLRHILNPRPMGNGKGGERAARHVTMEGMADASRCRDKLQRAVVIRVAHDGKLPIVFFANLYGRGEQDCDELHSCLLPLAVHLIISSPLMSVAFYIKFAEVGVREGGVSLEDEQVAGVFQHEGGRVTGRSSAL